MLYDQIDQQRGKTNREERKERRVIRRDREEEKETEERKKRERDGPAGAAPAAARERWQRRPATLRCSSGNAGRRAAVVARSAAGLTRGGDSGAAMVKRGSIVEIN
ncbi:hypothetical protein Syun_024996 [Stephania yunnanensis]|uniref:Uncharacterized protein n=1 Tax=Stephania yunnanensis TaxID=152371 RepID=A0AAP0HVE0_9MAGN